MWKKILLKIFPILILVGSLYVGWQTYEKGKSYHSKVSILESTINNLSQEIVQTRLKLNDSIAIYQAEIKSLQITKNNLEVKYGNLLELSKTKAKDVQNISEISSVAVGKDTVIAYVDTFGGIKTGLKDDFVKIDVEIFPDKNTIIEYEMRDSLTVLNIQKKHSWLFGLIKWCEPKGIKVINHNPKARISELKCIDIIE